VATARSRSSPRESRSRQDTHYHNESGGDRKLEPAYLDHAAGKFVHDLHLREVTTRKPQGAMCHDVPALMPHAQDRSALCRELLGHHRDLRRALVVEVGVRLIEQQDVWVGQYRAQQGDPRGLPD
jgi:hypothetical protein